MGSSLSNTSFNTSFLRLRQDGSHIYTREIRAKMSSLYAIPLTRCDVPSLHRVSSKQSTLSHAKVVLMYGLMFPGSGIEYSGVEANF